jgi:hypothetical protein
MLDDVSRRRRILDDSVWLGVPPPLRSLVVFVLLFGFAVLLGIADSKGSKVSDEFVDSVQWTVWRSVGSAALVVFMVLMAQAFRVLYDPARWGIEASAGRRRRYLVSAAIGIAVLAVNRLFYAGVGPDLPVRHLGFRTDVVLLVGLAASIPWLTIVWLANAECHDLANAVPKRGSHHEMSDYTAALHDTPGEAGQTEHFRRAVERLLLLWRLLLTCVSAFTIGVVAAVATSGALRGAFVAAHPDRKNEFPPANVLLNGGFFALALSIITVPLALSWRARAQQLVEHACPLPPDGKPSEEWVEEHARLEHLLHLDVSILRNPLTALSVFTPLLISALAAFLPTFAG